MKTADVYVAVALIENEGETDCFLMLQGTEKEVDDFIQDPSNGFPSKMTIQEYKNLMC